MIYVVQGRICGEYINYYYSPIIMSRNLYDFSDKIRQIRKVPKIIEKDLKEKLLMVKNEMLKKVAEVSGLSQKDVDTVLTAYTTTVVNTLTENRGEKIALGNLGIFKVKNVPERSGVAALAGGKAWTKPAHDEIQFRISRTVKELG